MSKRVLVEMEAEKIPESDGIEFEKWCEKRGFSILAGGRRAWSVEFGEYVRDSTHLLWFNGEPVALCKEDDFKELV